MLTFSFWPLGANNYVVELLKNLPQQKYQEDGVGPVWFSDAREATGAKSGANVYVGRPNVQLTKSA